MRMFILILLFSSAAIAGVTFTAPTRPASGVSGNKQVIFNDAGSFGSNAGFIFDKATGDIGIGISPTTILDVLSNISGAAIRMQGSTNPNISVVDTTNSVNTKIQSLNTSGFVGTETNHNFDLGTNNLSRLIIFAGGNIQNTNFTKLGSLAPSIKMAKLTGTGGTAEGWATDVAHGLGDITKIISATVLLTPSNGNIIPPGFTVVSEFEYDFFIDPTNVKVIATATNSGAILASSAFVILLTLEE